MPTPPATPSNAVSAARWALAWACVALQRLRDCRFLLVANLQVMQYEVPALYPLAQLRDRLRPVLHSVFEHRGETVPAAYLFTWTDQDPQGQTP